MKNAIAVLVLMVATACSCAAVHPKQESVADLIDSTVKVRMTIKGHQVATHPVTGVSLLGPMKERTRSGTGVVYGKTSGATAPIQSRILTANHVVEAPGLGSLVDIPNEEGQMRVEEIEYSIRTAQGLTCKFEVLKTGDNQTQDVATGVAFCDAGRVAPIAERVPAPGEKIQITGHPDGVTPAIVTEGYVGGWTDDGFLLTSAAVYGGNSGGAVWYQGQVIGLLVRVNTEYHHVSYVVPLHAVWKRINETQ